MLLTESQTIIDISLPLNGKTVIYPGNTPITIFPIQGKTSVSSKITLGSHTGTHIDAPSHVSVDGLTIDRIPLDIFIGTCRVLDMTTSEQAVLEKELEKKNIQEGERILLKTKNSLRGFTEFYDDYIYLSSDGARYLAKKKILLVGIDALSIKQRGSPDTTPHTALLERNIPILEGLNLAKVTEGTYILLAVPLSFTGIDGSPVRAVLFANTV